MLATYRLQLTDRFTFFDAYDLTPYFKELGISALYLSPIFEADPHHGYHITDPNQFSMARGGEVGFLKLASAGMQLIVDIVPNHLAPRAENRYWNDPDLRSKYFDLDKQTGQPRCFFNYYEIAALRMEDEDVFQEVHRLIARLCRDGLIHGLRIDHPDGLADPIEYLRRLQELTGFSDESIWVERFLGEHEPLLPGWPTAGTVGMEFLRDHQDLFVAPGSKEKFSKLYSEITGISTEFGEVMQAEKHLHARQTFRHYVDRLHREAPGIGREELIDALASFDSRTFIRAVHGVLTDADQESLRRANSLPESVRKILTLQEPASEEFIVFFQQLVCFVNSWSFLTSLWIHNRWVALNEWGSHPDRWHLDVETFHQHQKRRQDRSPRGLLSRQTHDTFHSSDARARMIGLTHNFEDWKHHVAKWMELNGQLRSHLNPNVEYRIYQDLCSVWPVEKERFLQNIGKWFGDTNGRANANDTNHDQSQRALDFANAIYSNEAFLADLSSFVERNADAGRFVVMGQLLLQLTSPGIPDIYWGDEVESFSLADPDQRRPVDWQRRKEILARLKSRGSDQAASMDEIKMRLIAETLALRSYLSSVFSHGAYEPIDAGPNICAFVRGGKIMTVVPLKPGVEKLPCPDGWRDLFADLPVGLYVRNETI